MAKPNSGLSGYAAKFAELLAMFCQLHRYDFIRTRAFLTLANFKLYRLAIV